MIRALPLLLLAGCATAMDEVRDGQPVIETTFSAIFNEPEAWEGKWVRISGWVDDDATLIVSEKDNDNDWWTLHLDPALKLRDPHFEGGIPSRAAVVSGKVDLSCARLFANAHAEMRSQGLSVFLNAEEPGPNAHCNRARGPSLVNVLVATPPESGR